MLDIIYGTLLGDGCIGRDRTSYRLTICHQKRSLAYLTWKAREIGHQKEFYSCISGYGSEMFSLRHYNKALLEEVYFTCIKDGKKVVTKDWTQHLTVRSLAVLYQDDGSWGKAGGRTKEGLRPSRRITFSVCNFDRDSHECICEWLKTFGLHPTIKIRPAKRNGKQKYYSYILLRPSDTSKLWNYVAPFLYLPWKVDMGPRSKFHKCACGNWTDYRSLFCDTCLFEVGPKKYRYAFYNRFGTTVKEKVDFKPHPLDVRWFDHQKLPYVCRCDLCLEMDPN